MSQGLEALKAGMPVLGHSGRYRLVKPLGLAGATAEVYQVRREEDDALFALKLMHPQLPSPMRKRFTGEMMTLQRLRDVEASLGTRHIPRLVECSDLREAATQRLSKELGRPFLLMDFAAGDDLSALLAREEKLAEEDAVEIVRQFAEVLYAVHGAGFTYSDMKLENLIWDGEARHLTVIDWNVVAEGRLDQDAGRDRLRAATYLYQMVTAIPMEIANDGDGVQQVADPGFRRSEAFRGLTAGIRHFLLDAFHLDPRSRHGGEADPVDATRRFLAQLSAQARRFEMPPEDLLARGGDAYADRQWQEALEDLDVLRLRAHLSLDEKQYGRLQEMLDGARRELEWIGRNAFHSGLGRYRRGLYQEARADFETALKDDPFDQEARLHAIAARLAARLGEQAFEPLSTAVAECVDAMTEGNLGVALGALEGLSDELRELPEVRSLLAEIEVRRAVRQGEELVDEDRLDEAEAGLRDANRRREELLYTEQLEESIGNLRQLWSGVEELRRLYARSDALERRGEFGEAAAVLWRARAISHGARSAQRRYQKAATLAGIRELVRRRDLGKAVRECDRAASLYRGEAAIESLRQEVERQRCGQLRRLAADARSRRNYLWEKELVEELCRLDPEDSAAPARLGEIAKDLAVGYREGVAELARQLECRRSAEICDEVVRKLSDNGWTQFDEGRALAAEAKALMRRIADLAQRFDRLDAEGDVEAVLQLLAEAQAERILLHGTSPEELREGIGQRLAESRLREIADRLRAGSIDEALERCESRLQIEPEEARRQELLALREKARDLAAAREQIRSVEGKIERSEDRGIRGLLSELRLRAELLDAVRRALRQEPQLEGLHGDRDPERLEVSLLRGLDQAMERLRSSAYGVLFTGAPGERTAVRDDASAALALLGELEVLVTGEPPALRRWRRWCEELLRLEDWIDLRSEAAASATPAGLAALLTPLGASDEVLAVLSRLGSENEPGQSRAALEEVSPDSPVAEWLRQAVEARSLEAALWQELGHNAPEARRRLDRHPRGLAPLRRCLPLAERAHAFLAGAPDPAQVSAPERLAIEREAAELARELGEVPRLRDGRYRRELGALAERLSRERQTRISELRARLAERIESFTLAESFENRVPIEQQVTEAVAELREIDEEAAAEAEKRFDHAVEYLLRDPAQHPAEAQDRDRLAELQRRVVELAEREPGRETRDYLARFDRDQTFRAVQPFFRRRHDRFRQALRRVQGPAPGRVEALLRLRLQYGEFPELVEALWQARREIAQAAARERFRELERLDAAALAEHWHEHESTLRALDASLLEERDRERYHQLEEAVGHLRILAEELGQPALAAYLHGRHNGRGAQWSRALEWGVAQRIGGRALAPATVRNLESTMQRILARGSVSPQTMSTFYYLEALIRRLRFPEAGPVGRAAGGRGGGR